MIAAEQVGRREQEAVGRRPGMGSGGGRTLAGPPPLPTDEADRCWAARIAAAVATRRR